MTKKELEQLKVGTLVYNGHTDGRIGMDGRTKVIVIRMPINTMSNDSKDFDERPEYWTVLEE